MERFEIHIDMQMMTSDLDIFKNSVKAISRMNIAHGEGMSYSVSDLQSKLQDKIYSMIEKEEDIKKAYFVYGEVTIQHKEKTRVYSIASAEFPGVFSMEQGETYH